MSPSTVPAFFRPATMSISVVLPLPLGPIRAVILPLAKEPDTPLMIVSGSGLALTVYESLSKVTGTPPPCFVGVWPCSSVDEIMSAVVTVAAGDDVIKWLGRCRSCVQNTVDACLQTSPRASRERKFQGRA
eukprot:1895150-Prymnesium_polylepis.2